MITLTKTRGVLDGHILPIELVSYDTVKTDEAVEQ